MSWRLTRRRDASSGSTSTRSRRTTKCAAAQTTAGSRSAATRCSWGRWMRTWSRIDAKTGRVKWNVNVGEFAHGYSDQPRAARGQGQGRHRCRRRRIRHSRVHRRVRCGNRQGGVAVQHDSGAGRAWVRDVEWSVEQGRLEERRRIRVGDRFLRSGAEPDLLGHRQSRSGLQPRATTRRQPLHGLRRCARRRHRQAPVALPVHAERSIRLGRDAGAGARGRARGRARPPSC